jgi:hypothetical protein
VEKYAWVLWLAVPVAATVLVALWSWWRGRPERRPTTPESMLAHAEYLNALTHSPRGTHRVSGYAAPRE